MKVALVTSSMPLAPWQNGITRAFVEAGLAAEVVPWEGMQPRSAINARYAVVWLPPAQLFEVEHDLEVVFNLGAGVDRLLANAVVPERLPIVRLVDAGMAVRMAEYVCFAIARATRGLERFGPGGLRDWNASRPRGKPPTVGVLGAGAIGGKIAEAAAMFGYPVRVWSRTPRTFAGMESFAGLEQLDVFLAGSNFLVNALPLTRDTENLLDRARLVEAAGGSTFDQCRARRDDRRRRFARSARRWPSWRRHARRVPRRAASGRPPVLVAPEGNRDAAFVRANPNCSGRNADRRCDRATRARRAGEFAAWLRRPHARVLIRSTAPVRGSSGTRRHERAPAQPN